MNKKETDTFCPASQQEWRQWLEANHRSKQFVWLVYYRKKTNIATLTWSEAVDEALCFGWIDSTRKTLDSETFMQLFTKRKPTGTWSKINKAKTEHLIEAKLMMQAGLDAIETAKKNGSWAILDEVEELIIPEDLETAFEARPGSKDFFSGLNKSAKKSILYWLISAKKHQTRQKRIQEIADLASLKQKPKLF